MSKEEKLIQKLLSNPTPVTFTYQDLVRLMSYFGYHLNEKHAGSRIRFWHNETKAVFSMHKPHPGNELKKYQVLEVIRFLRKQGDINE
ncbi:type II toxin-antitoxin system HicA family toxin [Anoxynatronum sibiricum]|uniref:Type II toxin-antitoxin system HicA family toxin n=1 Tax=Anoxynatronum sibiricum TaxID=210623 RepID=A0ABU9VXY5_9CLOT